MTKEEAIMDLEEISEMTIWNYRRLAANMAIEALSADAVEVVRCKDCKYFELDHFDRIDGIPLITAHEVCTKWGRGCKTSKDGFCFMAERKSNDGVRREDGEDE